MILLPLIFRSTVECNKVKHLPHTGADTVTVVVFELGGGEIGGGMGNHVVIDKVIVAG